VWSKTSGGIELGETVQKLSTPKGGMGGERSKEVECGPRRDALKRAVKAEQQKRKRNVKKKKTLKGLEN